MTTQTEALKLALEALEDRVSLMKWQIARDAVKEALAQPEQEPVARIGFLPEVGGGKYFEKLVAWKHLPAGALLYTTPPQRKPLTDEQIEKCFAESAGTFVSAGRAIEAAHGIKGD